MKCCAVLNELFWHVNQVSLMWEISLNKGYRLCAISHDCVLLYRKIFCHTECKYNCFSFPHWLQEFFQTQSQGLLGQHRIYLIGVMTTKHFAKLFCFLKYAQTLLSYRVIFFYLEPPKIFLVQDPIITLVEFLQVLEFVKEIGLRKIRGAPVKKSHPVVVKAVKCCFKPIIGLPSTLKGFTRKTEAYMSRQWYGIKITIE